MNKAFAQATDLFVNLNALFELFTAFLTVLFKALDYALVIALATVACSGFVSVLSKWSRALVLTVILFWIPNLNAQPHAQQSAQQSVKKSAQQCFFDAEQAYQHLLLQQQQAQLLKQNQKVNINSANEAQLTQLKGIGSGKAQQIILYREAFGPFQTVNDLAAVKGIGEKTVAKNRGRITVH